MKIIMNPPYKGNLHLKILSKVQRLFPNSEIVNLSPVRWLQDITAEDKVRSDWNVFKSIRKHTESVDLIDIITAQESFNARMTTDLGIYVISQEGGWESKSLWDPISVKIKNKIREDGFLKSFELNKKDGWRVKISSVRGQNQSNTSNPKPNWQKLLYFKDGKKDGKWWYEFYNRNQCSKETEEITTSIEFNSENEAKNFIETTSSKLGRYYYHHRYIDIQVYEDFFLWLPHYNKVWSDQELYEYFGLTNGEIKLVENFFEKMSYYKYEGSSR